MLGHFFSVFKRTPRVRCTAPLGSDESDPRGALLYAVVFCCNLHREFKWLHKKEGLRKMTQDLLEVAQLSLVLFDAKLFCYVLRNGILVDEDVHGLVSNEGL